VASTEADARAAAAALGGAEERFAFARAVSRLYEMQSAVYRAARPRGGGGGSGRGGGARTLAAAAAAAAPAAG
jgi:hypothetical protein